MARRPVPFFACAKKGTKESTPHFAALRVPDFSGAVRAAAQLALRAQTVLADFPRTAPEKSAAKKGGIKPSSTAHPCLGRGWGWLGLIPSSRSRDFGARPGLSAKVV